MHDTVFIVAILFDAGREIFEAVEGGGFFQDAAQYSKVVRVKLISLRCRV